MTLLKISPYQKLRDCVLNIASKNNAFSSFIVFLYDFFIGDFANITITIIGTVVIGSMLACQYFGVGFWFAVIVYIALLLLSMLANKYNREKNLDSKLQRQALYGTSEVLRAWSVCLQKCVKAIIASKKTPDSINTALKQADFQSAAFSVCEKLHNNLTKYCENEDVYITVYQKYQKGNNTYCKMIAYSTQVEPSTFNDEYEVPSSPENQLGKVPYHSYLFSLNATNIAILPDHDSIIDTFVIHDKSKERKDSLQQYIAIPIAPAKQGVLFLLQVDTCKESLFGQEKRQIERFVHSAIYPFSQILHMIYEESRAFEQLQRRR